jgi:transposase-like protein
VKGLAGASVLRVAIAESAENLRALMKKQKIALSYAKLQALYLIKIQAAETIRYLAVMMGRSESTIYYWLGLYREGGLSLLLEEPPNYLKGSKTAANTSMALRLLLYLWAN